MISSIFAYASAWKIFREQREKADRRKQAVVKESKRETSKSVQDPALREDGGETGVVLPSRWLMGLFYSVRKEANSERVLIEAALCKCVGEEVRNSP